MNHLSIVEPFALRAEALASDMEEAGLGAHITEGHAAFLRKLAASLRSAAAEGHLASRFHAEAEPARLPSATISILDQLRS
jgi:hypothetical protein